MTALDSRFDGIMELMHKMAFKRALFDANWKQFLTLKPSLFKMFFT